MQEYGSIIAQIVTSAAQIPVAGATLTISRKLPDGGQELLAAAHPTLPLLSGARQLRALPPQAQQVFALEQRASDLYALTLPRPQPCGTDLTTRLLRHD